jgi:hypothetical protein
MSKIYEALKRAENDRQADSRSGLAAPVETVLLSAADH